MQRFSVDQVLVEWCKLLGLAFKSVQNSCAKQRWTGQHAKCSLENSKLKEEKGIPMQVQVMLQGSEVG